MGKNSDGTFRPHPRGFYATPRSAILPLLPHLDGIRHFVEPCVGNGELAETLASFGYVCVWGTDLVVGEDAHRFNTGVMSALEITGEEPVFVLADAFITNPPWAEPRRNGEPLVSLIRHLAVILPTWLLLPADFAYTRYGAEFMRYCRKQIAVGRVKWIAGSDHDGKENCCWYLFDANDPGPTVFHTKDRGPPIYAPGIEELL